MPMDAGRDGRTRSTCSSSVSALGLAQDARARSAGRRGVLIARAGRRGRRRAPGLDEGQPGRGGPRSRRRQGDRHRPAIRRRRRPPRAGVTVAGRPRPGRPARWPPERAASLPGAERARRLVRSFRRALAGELVLPAIHLSSWSTALRDGREASVACRLDFLTARELEILRARRRQLDRRDRAAPRHQPDDRPEPREEHPGQARRPLEGRGRPLAWRVGLGIASPAAPDPPGVAFRTWSTRAGPRGWSSPEHPVVRRVVRLACEASPASRSSARPTRRRRAGAVCDDLRPTWVLDLALPDGPSDPRPERRRLRGRRGRALRSDRRRGSVLEALRLGRGGYLVKPAALRRVGERSGGCSPASA